KLKNKYKKSKCEYIILVDYENGSTIQFANLVYKQLIKADKKVYIAELNIYMVFKDAKHFIVVTATYDQDDAPTNSNRFLQLIDIIKQPQPFQFSVVRLGSLAYPDYCKFAFDVDASFHKDANASQALKPFTVNDKSVGAFQQWLDAWNEVVGLENQHIDWNLPQPKTVTFKVISKTEVGDQVDSTFLITLKSNRKQPFQSGDLLAIYPKNNHVERLYSIGNINDSIQLSVRLHAQGAGSGFLNHLQIGNSMQARIMTNA